MEPTLQDIGDYDSLKGTKKKVVWGVVLSGIVLGVIIAGAEYFFGTPTDAIHVDQKIGKMPFN